MQYHHTKREPEMAELIEGSERDRRRLAELLDGIRVGPGVDAMADGMREAVWADVRSHIRRRGIRMRIVRYAAAAAVMAGVVCGSWFMGGRRTESRLVAAAQPVSVSTPLGVKSDVVLPDGSRVRLNGGTRIVYPALFGDERAWRSTARPISRSSHDARKPFVVVHGTRSSRRCSERLSTCTPIPRMRITRSRWRRAACWWTAVPSRGACGCVPASRDSSRGPPGCCRCAG